MTVYTDSRAVSALLGLTLTAAQEARATDAAIAASEFVEAALDRSWLDAAPGVPEAVTDERHTVLGCRLRLRHRPVDEITDIKVRLRYAGATVYDLTEPYQYELVDPTVGEVYLSPTYDGQLLTVSYTATERPPDLIREFASALAAGMLALALADSASTTAALTGVRRYTLWGGDLSVEFGSVASGSDGSASGSTRVPALWAQIEALYSRKVSVA